MQRRHRDHTVYKVIVFGTLVLSMVACKSPDEYKMFQLLPSTKTEVTFKNQLTETDSFNILTFEYIYNGGGVGVGDVNNDGLTDICFAGNMVSSRLYLNKGDFRFQDVTKAASLTTNLWCTGVAMVDINQDGLLDIHISTAQPLMKKPPVANLLFLNKGLDKDGVPTFEEVAGKIGLADSSYSTQAAFLDYDLDGDLDVYLLNNALEFFNRNQALGPKDNGMARSVDKLYRNEGVTDGLPVFKDVSKEAGIVQEGWGLGIVVNDFNGDSYPDIYVANDFVSNDHLFINKRNGTFSNEINSMLKHQEQNGMGVDVADINNDGLNDIVALDMMPDDNLRQKTMFSTIGFDRFMLFQEKGYQDQYIRNVLQLNNGNQTFSDIGYLAGVYATDWSWSSLLADFDNDGFRDLFVGNGYRKDITDQDFIAYSKELGMFSNDRNRFNTIRNEVEKLPGVKKPNFIFKNNGDLTFSDQAKAWGLDQPSYSNGAAYADFDNDGDLDLVTNNINDEAFIYRNEVISGQTQETSFLRIKFKAENNMPGLGAKIWIYRGDKLYYAEHQTQRGYKSTVEEVEHFGFARADTTNIDSVRILWPRGKSELLKDISLNQVITLEEANAQPYTRKEPEVQKLLTETSDLLNIHYKHSEKNFTDFMEGQLSLPHRHSQSGPGLTVGDVNGDDREDFIVGGSAYQPATMFTQQKDGSFNNTLLPVKDAEDMGMLLFDADGDSDLDLYCVSGSSEFKNKFEMYQDRLYRNLGNGTFQLDSAALPEIRSSGSCVVANDFDKDGDLDVFVGGRVVSMRYPEAPESFLLVNDGKGKFHDRTSQLASELNKIGMVSSALWTDVNNDGWFDLAVVGEWMPLTFFISNNGTSFKQHKVENTSGWWNSINGGDFDNDGDIDYIAGNLGLNSVYKASQEEPVCVYAKDFDENGSMDPILCRYIQGTEYPVHPRETLTGQIPRLRGATQHYSEYGRKGIRDLIPKASMDGALTLKASLMASVYVENLGNNTFNVRQLPVDAQFSPLYGMSILDINDDGNLDILAVGNSYASEPLSGFYDASIGTCLQGDGAGNFSVIPIQQSGFFVDSDAKALSTLMLNDGTELILATQNKDSIKVFAKRQPKSERQELVPANATANSAVITLTNGKKRRHEFYYGNGYLSSSSRTIRKGKSIKEISIDR
ncbi:MAG TPA: VCBS repeat-containing protein [Chryseolinea sp.]